jgi:hypothetical protein
LANASDEENKAMKGSSDRKGLSSMSVRASETTGTHLAHWPPPQRGKESKPVFMKHPEGEPVKRAKPRGWRLTRAIFSEFADEE